MSHNASNGFDVIIVGAGPAGLCAAMYAGRGMLKALTIERGAPGGELLNTDLIEDYIGFESIKGWDLAQKMAEHAKKFGATIVTDTVEKVRKAGDGWFEVVTANGQTYRAPAVILTAGGTPVKLGVPGEKEYAGRGVSYLSMTSAPASWTSQSNWTPVPSRTRRVASESSGPTPSPGMNVTRWAMLGAPLLGCPQAYLSAAGGKRNTYD